MPWHALAIENTQLQVGQTVAWGLGAWDQGSTDGDGGTGCDNVGVSSDCVSDRGMEYSCSALGGLISQLL